MRNRGQGSIIRRPGTKNLYIRYYANDGRQIQEATGTNVKEVAERLLQQRLGELGLGIKPAQDVKSLKYENLRDAYVEEKQQHGAGYTSTVANVKHLDTFFAGISVLDINSDTIRNFTKTKRKEGLADPTIRRIIVTLRAMFNQAKKEEKIRHVDVPHFPLPADSEAREGFFEPDQFAKLLKHLPQHLHLFVKFLYLTGCRKGEAEQITWSMVARDCSAISVPKGITKSRKARTIPLGELSAELKKTFRDESKPVFDTRNLRKAWYASCAAAGFGTYDAKVRKYQGLEIHDLRRSAVRNLIHAGIDQGTAMSVSGHKTAHVFQRYNIVTVENQTNALNRVSEYNARQVKAAR